MRATLFAGSAASAAPMLFGGLGVYSVFAGPPLSGGEAQGAAILFVLAFSALLFVITAFPLVAWLLHRRGTLARRRFYNWLFVSLAGISLVPACILAGVGFGLGAFVFAPGIFVSMALMALPFRPLWFKFAS